MLNVILVVFAIYSVAFLMREASILDPLRDSLVRKSPFFFKMLACWYCTGIHAGWISYLLIEKIRNYSFSGLILWALAGGPIALIFNGLVNLLYKESDN